MRRSPWGAAALILLAPAAALACGVGWPSSTVETWTFLGFSLGRIESGFLSTLFVPDPGVQVLLVILAAALLVGAAWSLRRTPSLRTTPGSSPTRIALTLLAVIVLPFFKVTGPPPVPEVVMVPALLGALFLLPGLIALGLYTLAGRNPGVRQSFLGFSLFVLPVLACTSSGTYPLFVFTSLTTVPLTAAVGYAAVAAASLALARELVGRAPVGLRLALATLAALELLAIFFPTGIGDRGSWLGA